MEELRTTYEKVCEARYGSFESDVFCTCSVPRGSGLSKRETAKGPKAKGRCFEVQAGSWPEHRQQEVRHPRQSGSFCFISLVGRGAANVSGSLWLNVGMWSQELIDHCLLFYFVLINHAFIFPRWCEGRRGNFQSQSRVGLELIGFFFSFSSVSVFLSLSF